MGSMAYKESVAVGIPLDDDNENEEPPSISSASMHLLHHNFEFEEVKAEELPLWRRLKNSMLGRGRRRDSLRSEAVSCVQCGKKIPGRQTPLRKCTSVGFWIFALFGILQLLNILIGLAPSFPSDGIHRILRQWGKPGQIGEGLSSWPTDFSRGIIPIPCHSHNDYWRQVPLYSAIEAGCISVEADVWLIDDELYVGHSRASLTIERTLASLYINPLLDILSHQNPTTSFHPNGNTSLDGVFDTTPEQSLVLLIDFKTPGSDLWRSVISALEPLRSRKYLTHYSDVDGVVHGPITIVGTGNTPFELASSKSANPHLDVFFDAPLDQMWEHPREQQLPANSSSEIRPLLIDQDLYNTSNSYYASTSFADAIGYPWQGQLTNQQMSLIKGQIAGAHEKGLKARYWDLPFWPITLRNHIWDVLVKEGIDLLNVDDLAGATQRKWN